MQTTLFTIVAAFGLTTSMVSAAPLEARQESCSAFPWFIAPHDSADCSGSPAVFQPTSGPISSSPQNVYCQPLWDPSQAPHTFGSVAVNPTACSPTQNWQINLYTDGGCGTEPTVVTSSVCVPALSQFAAGKWEKFDAILIQ